MEMGNLWLIPVSLLLNSSLYWVLDNYLVKWFCRTFLSKTTQLECDLKELKESTSSNGKSFSNGHTFPKEPVKYPGKKLVTNGDIKTVSMETVGSVVAGITAVVSVIVMIETRHDTVNARSSILIPWSHIAAWYFIVDLYNMYDAYRVKNNIAHLPMHQRYLKYVRAKWPYVLHHVVLFTFGYQVVVNNSLRNYKGDFYVATIIGEDFSNPFVNTAKVLKILGQDKTKAYLANGIILVFAFFTVRILNIPFALTVYAAQYHNWEIMATLYQLRLVCYISIILQYILQIYWFILILKLALKGFFKMSNKDGSSDNEVIDTKKKEE